ncbi:uncharacterized protein LOC100903488 [Galendromus occidentalis]|uniref:Uncharacterized protein LOC100903488 n=1 Tax=Galendromus occidentalis TaxID=34638 RepID=A0AAJ7PAZ2_9ACAR|nr:uncharacterized protein LOC100903488 [Galendromus occidentalis]
MNSSPIYGCFLLLAWLSLSCLHLTHNGVDGAQKKFTFLDCVAQEHPATVSPRFQECVDASSSSGTLFRFINGFECILRLANAIRPDRSVDVGTLFAAVGDFKGTRFEKAVLDCEAPLPAIKFTICMLERFREICKNRIVIPRPSKNGIGSSTPAPSSTPPRAKTKPSKNSLKRRPR